MANLPPENRCTGRCFREENSLSIFSVQYNTSALFGKISIIQMPSFSATRGTRPSSVSSWRNRSQLF